MSVDPRYLLLVPALLADDRPRGEEQRQLSNVASVGSGRHRTGIGRFIGVAVASAAISAVAAAALVGFAAITGSASWAATAGVVTAVLSAIIVGFLIRALGRRRRTSGALLQHPVAGPVALLGCAAVVSLSWLMPATGSVRPEPVAGVEWLSRPDGSRLAYHVTRAPHAVRPPVIAVHGGPGVADMAHDVPAFAGMARDRDVWVYDRIGTGASTRLTDPTRYTTMRAVQDLEAMRARTGSDQVVLHGHSWGARIAVSYRLHHPDHVAALVLSAPGDLPVNGAAAPGDLTTQLDRSQKTRLYARLARPRNLFTYAMTVADPRTAHRFASDREMDRRFAAIYTDSAAALFCDDRLVHRVGTTGVGYYAHYAPQLQPDHGARVDLNALRKINIPVLIIKPACDYLPWSTAGYRQAFPQAQLVMLPDAGHAAYVEQPATYLELVNAFLDGRRLPQPTITGDTIPAGYRGTR